MKTKFIKVQVNERLPSEKYRSVFTNVGLAYINEESNWRDENVNDVNPEYFLDEVPDREEEMREMLEECKNQLEYLNSKFPATGTTNNILSRLTQLLNK